MTLTSPATRTVRARILAGAAIGIIGGFTTTFFTSIGQFVKPISDEFGWGRTELSVVIVLAAFGSAIASPAAGRLVQRHGPRPVVAVSGGFLATALVAFSVAPASTAYLAVLALMTGILAVGTTPIALLAVVPCFFDRRLGLAFGVLMGVSAVGAGILQVVVGSTIAGSGWRSAYLMLAGVAVVFIALALVIGFPPGTGPQGTTTEAAGEGLTVREAVHGRPFLLLITALLLSAVGTLGFTIHFVPFVTDKGISAEAAAGAAAVAGMGVALGRFVSGALLDRVNAVRLTGVIFVVAAAGLAAPAALPTSPVVVYALCALTGGFALGAEGDIIPFLVRRYCGAAFYPATLGVAIGAYTLGSAIGPVLFGVSFDRLGTYTPALHVAAAGMLAGAALLQFMGPYRFPDRPRAVRAAGH
jgi:predicted MFS family arabinose efflux permease